jgi:hypothetical protein
MLVVVTVDVDPSVEEAFNRWYDEVHVPDILRCPGFLRAERFVGEESPRYLAIYEIADAAALESPELRAVRGWGPFEPHVSSYKRRIYRTVPGRRR